ncbi:hypothetical protein KR067_003078 [Drosophila pandora]|nr:hypothetical protein KR067_003078 [Drosophila pandora]
MQQQQQQFQHFQHLHHHHHHHHHLQQQQQIQQVQSDSQLEHRNSPDPEAERNPNRDRQQNRSSMDFRNLCQRLDVDSLRAKLPSLPQIKLPKALPKLRGRKIFRSSKSGSTRANAGSTKDRGYTGPPHQQSYQSQLQVAATSQQFINRTPQRISTISSLMYEGGCGGGGEAGEDIRRSESQPGTYRSAGSLDDDYYAPGSGERASRPISPIKMPSGSEEAAGGSGPSQPPTLTQRIQKGYKSLSELRLKHIFAKQTTVRRDNIEVDRYVEQYERELRSEKRARERRDREIAENYDIKIKTLAGTRQNTFEEDEVEHEQFERRDKGHQDTDESGLEATPPLPSRRKPGIAATRFAKVRKPPLEMEAAGQEHDPDQDEEAKASPSKENQPPPRSSSYKQLLSKLPHLPSLPNLPQLSRTKAEKPPSEEVAPTKSGLRQNIKRIRKSIKRPAKLKPKAPTSQDTDDEEESEEKKEPGKDPASKPPRTSSTNLRARLGRFASTEQLQQRWRKSFKRTGKDEAPKEETAAVAGGVLGGFLLGSQLEKTLGKLNEKMHQIKFFQRQGQAAGAASKQPKPNTVGHEPVELDDDNELEATYHHSDSDDSGEDVSADEAFGHIQPETSPEDPIRRKKPLLAEPREREREKEAPAPAPPPAKDQAALPAAKAAHASRQMAKLAEIQAASKGGAGTTAWSSESLEEIADEDYPRVLIHQEHSDNFESTLIIAVATKSPSPQQLPAPKASPWLPNDQIISGFRQEREREQEQAWPAPALYKPKSIDIFEASGGGGTASAFADFDEALRNAPVLRISAGSISSSIEEKDEGHTRVTRIRVQSPQIGNSRESLMAQDEEEEEEEEEEEGEPEEEDEDDEEEDLEMELPVEAIDLDDSLSERPPSASPPPPPLPQRRPPPIPKVIDNTPIYDAVPPPLPITKPPPNEAKAPEAPTTAPTPVPARVSLPQRSASMSRPAKPLVKTSSLRLTYNEQVRPGDIGKVNKLISRFEGGRPRLCPRRMHSEEYEREEEDELRQEEVLVQKIRVIDSVTPTNRNVVVIPQIVLNNNSDREEKPKGESPLTKDTKDLTLDRQNSNCSRSEYGSPLSFPSNRRSRTPTNLTNNNNPTTSPSNPRQNPNPNQNQNPITIQHQRRSRRSMTRDDDNFYSFDSDEENSYYSISPSGSSRYVVEI